MGGSRVISDISVAYFRIQALFKQINNIKKIVKKISRSTTEINSNSYG